MANVLEEHLRDIDVYKRQPKDIIDQWRAISDEICRREGLSLSLIHI